MDDTDFFSTETIIMPIGFRLFNYLYRKQSERYSAKWDRGLNVHNIDSSKICVKVNILTSV